MAFAIPPSPGQASMLPSPRLPPPAVNPGMGRGLIRLIPSSQLTQIEQEKNAAAVPPNEELAMSELARHIRTTWEEMRNHRNSANSGAGGVSLNERLMIALRAFNGEYDSQKLAQIRAFGGSEVYARMIANKCRGATSLLREVYLGTEKAWEIEPTPNPSIPDDVAQGVAKLLSFEVEGLMRSGQPIDQLALQQRAVALMDDARRAAKKKAEDEAKEADDAVDDILVEGGWYRAFAEFLIDLPLFPFACIKGPTVRMVWDLKWENGKPVTAQIPRMFWDRVSPFDLYWSPGASRVEDAEFIERVPLTRARLSEIMDLPGFNKEAIKEVLDAFSRGGLHDWMDSTDQLRAQSEGRENPNMNRSRTIASAEYHGSVPARFLQEYGFNLADYGIDDLDKEVSVQAWLIDRWVIKAQLTPSPRKRPPYYLTSFEKVPGTIAGNALPDILSDVQDVANASLRSLVNNMGIASGPQVEVQLDRLAPGQNWNDIYPWKRWAVTADPIAGTTEKPAIKFYQPQDHAQTHLGVYKEMGNIADELSAIPKYITGSERMGGAGRTASGLSMLMGNANKMLQTVAFNADNDVIEPSLQGLYDMVMIADAGMKLRGDENIQVKGAVVAQKRELERQRQLEFLRNTANPFDMQILGMEGRAKVLDAVASTLGFPDRIIPDPEVLKQVMGPAAAPGAPPPGPANTGNPPPKPAMVTGPSTNLTQPDASRGT